jgi:uncharacterized membrane protein
MIKIFMDPKIFLILYIVMIYLSFMSEVLVKHIHFLVTRSHYKEHHFTLGRYILSLIFPFIVFLIIYLHLGSSFLYTFIASAILGTMAEWTVGWWFYQVMGTRLWTYHRYAITKYTSFLSIPLWGLVGVFLLLVIRLFI